VTELLPVLVAFIGFLIALLSETGRIPVDNPATHLELTMIHEAMILEYSGKRLALLEWANANKLFVFAGIACSVFFPWGVVAPGSAYTFGAVLIATAVFMLKVLVLAFSIATIESVMAKLRIFRVPQLLFTGFIIGAVALALITL
jgi:formate hydrogenlyase subunit 4